MSDFYEEVSRLLRRLKDAIEQPLSPDDAEDMRAAMGHLRAILNRKGLS